MFSVQIHTKTELATPLFTNRGAFLILDLLIELLLEPQKRKRRPPNNSSRQYYCRSTTTEGSSKCGKCGFLVFFSDHESSRTITHSLCLFVLPLEIFHLEESGWVHQLNCRSACCPPAQTERAGNLTLCRREQQTITFNITDCCF